MELLQGETLACKVLGSPLGIDCLLNWAVQIADALDAAHLHGVIHRERPWRVVTTGDENEFGKQYSADCREWTEADVNLELEARL
jgi:hypothetical protein